MIVEESRITGKGQIQVPARIRHALGAKRGDTFVFTLSDNGEIRVTLVQRKNLLELAGSLPVKKEFPGFDEEEEITRKKRAGKKGESRGH